MTAVTFKEFALQDDNLDRVRPDDARSPACVTSSRSATRRSCVRHLHKTARDWVETYRRECASNAADKTREKDAAR